MREHAKDTILAELRARIARIEGGQVSISVAETDEDGPQVMDVPRGRGGGLPALGSSDVTAAGREASKAAGPNRPLSLGVAEIDCRLPGRGLQPGRLHEVVGSQEGAGTGFVVHLLRRLMERDRGDGASGRGGHLGGAGGGGGPVLWCTPRETLYAPGLASRGIDIDRLVCVVASRREDRLWAMEEALRCQGVAAVVGELRARETVDLTASRRLQLAAGQGSALALLLRPPPPGLLAAGAARDRPGRPAREQDGDALADDGTADAAAGDPGLDPIGLGVLDMGQLGASAAVTRWHVRPLPLALEDGAAGADDDMGRRARWRLTLLRSRTGARHAWTVEVDHATGDLALAAPLRDRSRAAADRAVA